MNYVFTDWVWLFFIYSFLGWIWETVYVSLRTKKPIKRGFLFGPWLPIYGFGALIILWVIGPYRDRWYMVYGLGVIAATALEALTGALMESLFHMRYWDYSHEHLNYKGYICLKASLFWGVFALLLDKIINPNINKILAVIDGYDGILWVLMILLAADIAASVNKALNISNFMTLSANAEQTIAEAERKVKSFADDLRLKIDLKESFVNETVIGKNGAKNRLFEVLNQHNDQRIKHLKELIGYTDELMKEIRKQISKSVSCERQKKLQILYRRINDFRLVLNEALNGLELNRKKQIKRIAGLMNSYPNLTSKKYKEMIAGIKKITGR